MLSVSSSPAIFTSRRIQDNHIILYSFINFIVNPSPLNNYYAATEWHQIYEDAIGILVWVG